MKKSKKLIAATLCLTSALALCACKGETENQKQYNETKDKVLGIYTEKETEKKSKEAMNFDLKELNEYQKNEITVKSAKVLSGIAVLNDKIYASDEKNDCIYMLSPSGEVLKKSGKSGNGNLEFLKPNNIKVLKDKIYVLDSGNSRVQILDKDLNYIDQISIAISKEDKENDPEFVFSKMYVNDKGIFLNGLSLNTNDKIFYYNFDNKKVSKIGYNFYGPVSGYNNEVLAINSTSKTYDKKNDTFGSMTGMNYLLKVNTADKSLEKIKELPVGIEVSDFYVDGSDIIAFSQSNMALMKFDIKGNYIGALSVLKDMNSDKVNSISIAKGNDNNIYLTDSYSNVLISLHKK